MNNEELEVALNLRDKFSVNRFDEKKTLLKLRHALAMQLLKIRDDISTSRHIERLEILNNRRMK